MSEIAIVLQEIADRLEQEDAAIIGRVELAGEVLSVCDGKLKLTAQLYDEPDSPPSLVHGHVVANVEDDSEEERCFDACLIGFASERVESLHEIGKNWVTLAAGPILSLIRGTPALNADPFEGSEKWGIRDCQGFAGPLMMQMLDDPENTSDVEHLGEADLFTYATELAPAGTFHIAKVIIQANPEQGWTRSLEIDGHEVSYTDSPWTEGPTLPKQRVIGSRFAVFSYPEPSSEKGQSSENSFRVKMDKTIQRLIDCFQQCDGDAERVVEAMVSEGYQREVVGWLVFIVPLAFGRAVLARLGIKLSPFYIHVTTDGHIQKTLMSDIGYARAFCIATKLSQTAQDEAFRTLALLSSEVTAVNNAIQNKQHKLEDLELFPPVVPGPGVDQKAVDRAVEAVLAKIEAEKESVQNNHSKKRPW